MAKKSRKKAPKPEPFRWWRLFRLAPAMAVTAGLFAGLGYAARWAGGDLAARERYAVPVADLRVNTPPHTDSDKFLTEVKLLGDLPDRVSAVAPDLSDQLTAAFRLHPWVEQVTAVTVAPDGGVHVSLQFRSPALAIRWTVGGVTTTRAVTADGILLPATVDPTGLPVLTTERTITEATDGRPWPEVDVSRAVELVQRHPCERVERTRTGWRLTDADGKVLTIDAP